MNAGNTQKVLKGISAAAGVTSGKIYLYAADRPEVTQQFCENAENEFARYVSARRAAEAELQRIADTRTGDASNKAEIFIAHIDILMDEEINEQIKSCIYEKKHTAEFAVQSAYDHCAALFEQMDDPLIRERKADLFDVSIRLLRLLEGRPERSIAALHEPVVVAAHDLLPSDTATLDRQNVLGILTEAGNVTSHTAIIAKNYGIPAILGVSDLMKTVSDGMTVILDAEAGMIYLDPAPELLHGYAQKMQAQEQARLLDQSNLKQELKTADGVRIFIGSNIGAPQKDMQAEAENVDCVGLFRTEFLYMENIHLPTEDEQFEVYRSILQAYGNKPVLMRTLDIGGDKTVPYMRLPKEDNPFLGVRALRLCYEQPELLKTQLRAALRASVFGKLEIMFPMVTSLDDIRWAKGMLCQVGAELESEGVLWDHNIPIGIMMEVPSIMMIADQVAHEVDFASVGTNDLCQYLTASDRLNPNTSRYYQSFHPAVFRLLHYAAAEFVKQKKQLSVCGELGGDPLAAPVLVGLGIQKLSMDHSAVAKIKRVLSQMRLEEMEQLAQSVLQCGTEEAVRQLLRATLAIPQYTGKEGQYDSKAGGCHQ